jgi:hypothetical protein
MLSLRYWEFCRRRDCGDREFLPGLEERIFARTWLQQFKTDARDMLAIRGLLAQESIVGSLSQMPDSVVIHQLVELLASRRLHVHYQASFRPFRGGKKPLTSGVPEESAAFPIVERRPRSAPSDEPAPDSLPLTLPENTDVAAQAAVLTAAAAAGAAGCYICQKLARG